MNAALAELLHNPLLWRGDQLARADAVVSSGLVELDGELPGGGWPRGGLVELLADDEGIGELRLVLPALRRLVEAGEWIMLVAPPHIPYAPAFAGRGIDPSRVLVVAAAEEKQRWWAAEQVLRANSAGAVLFWPHTVNDQRLRRLQLAAQEGVALAFMFTGTARAAQPSPAPLRIRLAAQEAQLRVDVFKRRGSVMTRPLLLDTGSDHDHRQCVPAVNTRVPTPLPTARLAVQRLPSFRRHYPVGAQAKVWNRALARADEARRVPGPDPRGGSFSRPEKARARTP
jgi:protein ImuA